VCGNNVAGVPATVPATVIVVVPMADNC